MIIGLLDHDQGKLNDLSLEMLTLARGLAGQLGVPLGAILVGEAARPLAERLPAYGVSIAYVVQHPGLDDYAPEAWAQGTIEVMQSARPQAVLAPGSQRGNEVMAHLAARLGLPMAANCTEVRPGDPYQVTRLRWGGSLLEEARLKGETRLLTIAPQAVAAEAAAEAAALEVKTVTPALAEKDFRVRVAGRVAAAEGRVSLSEAHVVVGGGRGVGSAENFKALEELAGLLGGVVGVSRAVTSLGWRPHAEQVGQTGSRIAPEVYIACGISGASQHMVGCKGARHILAVNTDPEAPILSRAEYAIIGDLNQVVPALSAAIRRARGQM